MPDILPAVDATQFYRLPTKTRNQLASDISNPATPEGSAVADVVNLLATSQIDDAAEAAVDAAFAIGAPGMMRVEKGTLTDINTARPTWAGDVNWYVPVGSPPPLNIIDGDLVTYVEIDPVPWTPAMLPSLAAWFDAQTLAVANGGQVSSWPNLATGGNAAVQATGANQPVMNTTKIAGHPAVIADGTNDRLSFAVTAFTGPITIYIVAGTDLADNTSGSDFLLGAKDSASAVGRCDIYRTTGEAYTVQRVGTMASAAAAWTTGTKTMVVATNGAASSLTVNGSSVATGNISNGAEVTEWSLFSRADAANFFPGYIGELVIVHGTVSAENNTNMLDYLATRWA